MKKVMEKVMVGLAIVCILIMTQCTLFVNAAEITPYYNNTYFANTTASITNTGSIKITNSYEAKTSMTKAVITTYIEKRVLGIFWTKVDIGTTDDEWIDTIYSTTYEGYHTHQLEKTGTYRVKVEYVFYGTGGSADTIEKEIEKTY